MAAKINKKRLPHRKYFSCIGEDGDFRCQRFSLDVYRPCCWHLRYLPWESCSLEPCPVTNTPMQYVLEDPTLF